MFLSLYYSKYTSKCVPVCVSFSQTSIAFCCVYTSQPSLMSPMSPLFKPFQDCLRHLQVPRKNLNSKQMIGEGAFGEVCALVININFICVHVSVQLLYIICTVVNPRPRRGQRVIVVRLCVCLSVISESPHLAAMALRLQHGQSSHNTLLVLIVPDFYVKASLSNKS